MLCPMEYWLNKNKYINYYTEWSILLHTIYIYTYLLHSVNLYVFDLFIFFYTNY